MTTPTPRTDAEENARVLFDECQRLKRALADREAELAEIHATGGCSYIRLNEALQRAEEAERELAAMKAENSKLRSALEIVHFKREPWQ